MTEQEKLIIQSIKEMGFDRTAYRRDLVSAVILKAIHALEQTQWIPVSERLPEEGGRYLVYTWSHEIGTAQYIDGYWNIKTPISAWMPLPEPYKVEPQESEETE